MPDEHNLADGEVRTTVSTLSCYHKISHLTRKRHMSTNDFENSLDVLKILSEALTVPRSLDDGLDQITNMTRKLLDTEQAGFLFRDEDTHNLILRSAVGIEGDKREWVFQIPARRSIWRRSSIRSTG